MGDSADPWGGSLWSGRSVWDDFNRSFREMERVRSRMEQHMPKLMQDQGDISMHSEAGGGPFSTSSSSQRVTETNQDGKQTTRETSFERRRIGGLLEERTVERDSDGNERTTTRRGLGNKMRELIVDVNSKGERRQTENLRHIKPEEAAQFDAQWESERARIDTQNRMLGAGAQRPQLAAGSGQKHETPQQAQIGSKPNEQMDARMAQGQNTRQAI